MRLYNFHAVFGVPTIGILGASVDRLNRQISQIIKSRYEIHNYGAASARVLILGTIKPI